ncbi:MAG: pyridoxamine 5'-phosphate oxidase [Burkholderiales bacterium]
MLDYDYPFLLFKEWHQDVYKCAAITEPAAMALATVNKEGIPAVRMVLLRHFDERGFVFYTNLLSRKGHDLQATQKAALCFYWMPLHKQVRIEGEVTLVAPEEADAYFATRPRGSQIGAWASKQSSMLANPALLTKRVDDFTEKFADKTIPRPSFWSGFRVIPHYFEFWQEGSYRLHTRRAFSKAENGWKEEYLYP